VPKSPVKSDDDEDKAVKRQKRIIEDQKILITAITLHQQRAQRLTEKMLTKLKADMEEKITQTEKKLLLAIHKPKVIANQKGSIFSIKNIIIASIILLVIGAIFSLISYLFKFILS